MGKNSKSRRDAKRKKAIRRSNIRKAQKNSQKKQKLSQPILTMMENPLENLTDEQRKELITEVGKNSKESAIKSFNSLDEKLRVYDPISLIALLSGYGLTVGAGDNGFQSDESVGKLNQSHIEILQALILQLPEKELGKKLITPDIVQTVWEQLIELSQSFQFSRMNDGLIGASKDKMAVGQIQEMLRGHTQGVRNWGFYSQVINISKEIYGFFDDILSQEIGFSASNIIDTFAFITFSLEKLLTDRFQILSELKAIKRPYDLLLKYHEIIGQGKEETDKFASSFDLNTISTENLFFMVLSHYDLRMADNYYVDIAKLSNHLCIEQEKAKRILENFSFSFGALSDHKKEFFFLDNPVWNKPVIKDGDKYFCALPQLFFSFVLSSMDDIIEKIDKERLHKRRADYLEKKIEDIVKRRFPSAQTVSGLKWDFDGTQYETDLVTFIDSHALIIEAKSQRVSKSALRGAPDRIKRHLKEILVEPSIQSYRFQQKLEKLKLNIQSDKDLIAKLPIDFSNIHKFIRVSVSLEDFASLQANLHLFEQTGWLPDDFIPCPTMNLADFETLFDFLEHPVQIIHYLQRRTELEGDIRFIGDELDFMGLYITTLLNVGNITTDDQSEIIITDMSAPLDKYYMSRDQGIIIEKPKPQISQLFKEIFHKLEERSTARWTEIGAILNRFSPADQLKLVKHLKTLNKIVEKKWKQEGHKNTTIYNPPKSSEYALAFVLYKDENAKDRDKFIEHASNIGLEPDHVKYCIIIAKNIDMDDSPYHFIALAEPSNENPNKEHADG